MADLDGIFLDFYGTLAAGDRAAVVAICEKVVGDHGLSVTGEAIADVWGRRYFNAIESCDSVNFRSLTDLEHDTLVESMGPHVDNLDARPYIAMLNEYLARPFLFDEVRGVLEALALPVCIVSNADDRELHAAIEHLGLRFEGVVTSERARSYKPDAEIFRVALELTGWAPERVLHIGDSLQSDVGGAQKLGIQAVWVNRAERILDIGTHTPDFTWSDLRPLLTL